MQGIFAEAKGKRGKEFGCGRDVGKHLIRQWVMRLLGSQDGGQGPLALLCLHADPFPRQSLCSCTPGKISNNTLAFASEGFAPNSCQAVTFHQKFTL